MALTLWQPLREIQDVQREVNRLFDDVLTPVRGNGGNSLRGTLSPAAELQETADNYQLRLEVPGMQPNDVDIEATAESISIRGERKSEKTEENNGVTHTEFRYGQFQRVIPLPGRIDNQNVKAEYQDGILHLTLPKAEDEKSRVVKVTVDQ